MARIELICGPQEHSDYRVEDGQTVDIVRYGDGKEDGYAVEIIKFSLPGHNDADVLHEFVERGVRIIIETL